MMRCLSDNGLSLDSISTTDDKIPSNKEAPRNKSSSKYLFPQDELYDLHRPEESKNNSSDLEIFQSAAEAGAPVHSGLFSVV